MQRGFSRGFTLVEISIVITMIGLVIGSVVIGRDFVRAFEMRKVHRQYQHFVTAVHTFRSKYNCLPGDCEHAEEIFGSDPLGCPSPENSPPSHYACNGNGDGALSGEGLEAWRQLASAELIEGVYNGAPFVDDEEPNLYQFRPGYNCPRLLSEDMCWMWVDKADRWAITSVPGDYSTTLLAMWPGSSVFEEASWFQEWFPLVSNAYALGDDIDITHNESVSLMFTPEEALQYDVKYDNGHPYTGTVMAGAGLFVPPGCVSNGKYDLSMNRRACALFYRTSF